MNPDRVEPKIANQCNAPTRKKFKPAVSPVQHQDRLNKLTSSGRTLQFLFNNFGNDLETHTAVVGDSIVDSLCVDHCVVYSLSGGKVEDFAYLLDTLAAYRNIIFMIVGNNLSYYDKPGEEPEEVLKKIQEFRKKLTELPKKPTVIACTVLKRLKANHDNITRFNTMLNLAPMPSFRMHQEVSKAKFFKETDGIHLTEEGYRALACRINKFFREKNLK